MIGHKGKNKEFIEYIERVASHEEMSYIEAIVAYCQREGIEVDSVIGIIPKSIKEKIEAEAIDLNWIKSNTYKLPIED